MERNVRKIEVLYEKNFKRNLYKIMEIRGFNMARLCREIDIERDSIDHAFKRKSRLRFSVMQAICVTLKCSINDLISEELPDATTLP